MHIIRTAIILFCMNWTLSSHAEPDTLTHKPIRHQIGFDIRPGYILPTKSFFEGENAQGKPMRSVLSAHLKYAFRTFRTFEIRFPLQSRLALGTALPTRLSGRRHFVYIVFQHFRTREPCQRLCVSRLADSPLLLPADLKLRMEFRRIVRLEEIQ